MSRTPRWRIYERFIAGLQAKARASDEITVAPNVKLVGAITGRKRQVDVLIDARLGEDIDRRVIVDAKLRKRKVNVKDVESFEGMMKDCRASRGIIVCSSGFTETARRRAQNAITISLIESDQLESFDPSDWHGCAGNCADQKDRGWVLYDAPFGFWLGSSPLSIFAIGKCDRCRDFHVWCWDCDARFALIGDEAEHKCDCDRFWLTALENEGTDARGNVLESVMLVMQPLDVITRPIIFDRRPLQ